MSNSIEALKWRYATKQYDVTKKLSGEQVATIKEALRLAPSSFGLQPWHFVVVENADLRTKLRAAGYNQPQITDASHLVVLASEKNVDATLVAKYMESIAKQKGIAVENLAGFSTMLNGAIAAKGEAGAREWAARQVYIALGVVVTVAALEGIDASPMEGFNNKQFDEILGLGEKGLASQAIVALGFRSADDEAAGAPKVRYAESEVITIA
jgi:nitroreductase / dihydropteridine reductase